jgi:hypothetical protein
VNAQEHEHEPVPGLPERLPEGERLLWRGSPDWRVLALKTFHVRKVAIYFAVLSAWRVGVVLSDGRSAGEALVAGAFVALLGAVAAGVLTTLAWLYGRSTIYTITDRRVVLRFGVALPMALNIPFKAIGAAAVARQARGTADIPLTLNDGTRIAYLHLWPNVRPWRFAQPQPMLSAVPEGARVAEILGRALQEAYGQPVQQGSTMRAPQPASGSRDIGGPLTAAHA